MSILPKIKKGTKMMMTMMKINMAVLEDSLIKKNNKNLFNMKIKIKVNI